VAPTDNRGDRPTGPGIVGLDPTARRRPPTDPKGRTQRPRSLDGAVLGLLSNTKGQATALLEAIRRELEHTTRFAGHVLVTKPGFSVPPTAEGWKELTSKATVAIVGFGG
jgi:hypothetical protein